MNDLITDINNLISAVKAQQWFAAFMLIVKIANEVFSALGKQGTAPHQAMMSGPAFSMGSAEACCDALAAEVSKGVGKINWQNVLGIIKTLLPFILPFLSPAKP